MVGKERNKIFFDNLFGGYKKNDHLFMTITAMGFPKNWEEEPFWCSAPRG